MATKIVPSTSKQGHHAGAETYGQSDHPQRMANVKIVQNTALLLSGRAALNPAVRFSVMWPRKILSGRGL